ncbi:unnamed protein product [Linum trigynum]|uniref:Uncharacterized protein n=1 Tax=Linum trigynum TaxID=586398 RepID=A0AAV2CRH1_9ROSI
MIDEGKKRSKQLRGEIKRYLSNCMSHDPDIQRSDSIKKGGLRKKHPSETVVKNLKGWHKDVHRKSRVFVRHMSSQMNRFLSDVEVEQGQLELMDQVFANSTIAGMLRR